MYKVDKIESENFPKETFRLLYEVDLDGNNSEWRVCVKDIIKHYSKFYKIEPVNVPEFMEEEDFVELIYTIDGERLEFSCDFLFSSIYVTTEIPELTLKLRDELVSKVGWDDNSSS